MTHQWIMFMTQSKRCPSCFSPFTRSSSINIVDVTSRNLSYCMTVVGKKNEHIENSANGQTLKDLRNSMWDDMFENMQISFSETKCFSKNCGHMNPWPGVDFEENFRISFDFQVSNGFGGVISLCSPRNRFVVIKQITNWHWAHLLIGWHFQSLNSIKSERHLIYLSSIKGTTPYK